jgi:uncharacterized protein with GYD domain
MQFLIRFSYTSRSIKALLQRPDLDHAGEASALLASLDAKLLGYWYAFDEFDGVVLIEAADSSIAAAAAMAVGGSGEVSRLQTTVLLSMDEAHLAMRKAATATHVPRAQEEG